jgi:hypothetical protein
LYGFNCFSNFAICCKTIEHILASKIMKHGEENKSCIRYNMDLDLGRSLGELLSPHWLRQR